MASPWRLELDEDSLAGSDFVEVRIGKLNGSGRSGEEKEDGSFHCFDICVSA
jgi:hypothetical protein